MWPRPNRAWLVVCLVLSSCSQDETARVAAEDSLLVGYWDLPLDAQGEAPDGWTDIEASLDPQECQQCHPDQYREWSTAVHSKAFSPGFVGQLVNFDFIDAAACMECHAPLYEQRTAFEMAMISGQGHVRESQGLAAAGNSCAGCHVRGHKRFGPPKRDTGAVGQSALAAPHGGVYRTAFFESSEFCKGCHQFPQEMAVNGKPLENTYAEWQASPQAKEGKTCQNCHMPERRHLWRGIHDPDMVGSGLDARFEVDHEKARFELKSVGVGHAFPTYATPKVIMRGVSIGVSGEVVPGTDVSYVIQRRIESLGGRWVEHFDTRLMPGETATLDILWGETGRVKMWLEVHPDDFYDHDVYDILLDQLPEGSAASLISQANRDAVGNRFSLFETELERPVDARR